MITEQQHIDKKQKIIMGSLQSLLTVSEVAEFLRLTPKGIYSLVERRRIPFLKVSNRVRFLESDVISWLRKNRVPTLEEKQ